MTGRENTLLLALYWSKDSIGGRCWEKEAA